MQKSQEETKNELKERMENMQRRQETKERMEKGVENVQKCQDLNNSLEEKINCVENRIAEKMVEEIAIVEEKIEKVEGRIEEVAENFNLVSQRVEDLEKKLLA
ncbi:hypothetical protein TNCV_3098991 [Trichonephila clavipes]|nr:hypothetical protein TNCV_3098991 [Trichonephila clavipes]